jgi:hypothetical protein
MTKTNVLIAGFIGAIMAACGTAKVAESKTMYVSATTQPCSAGVMEKECLQVKWDKNQASWENFYNEIEGFTYETGNEYELLVKESKVANPPADASSLKYTLTKIVSKNKVATAKKPYTSSHVFSAQFDGIQFHQCMGLTSLCPEECGHSGNMAVFTVKSYQEFVVNGQGGTEKLETYRVLISDFHKKDLNQPYVAQIKSLKPGDIVTIAVDYVYDTTKSTVQTVENILSITKK